MKEGADRCVLPFQLAGWELTGQIAGKVWDCGERSRLRPGSSNHLRVIFRESVRFCFRRKTSAGSCFAFGRAEG